MGRCIYLFLWAMAAAAAACGPARGETQACDGLQAGPALTVAQVLDGETLLLHDGTQLRLIGALAPHGSDAGARPQAWPFEVAARAELEALVLGRTIEIGYGGAQRDRYGRHLGHAFLPPGAADGARLWVQGRMLSLGLARAATTPQNGACAGALLAAERAARTHRLGLWAEAAYAVRRADAPEALVPLRGSFQVVEGRVTRARRVRAGLRLEFAPEGRRFGLTVQVPAPRSGSNRAEAGRLPTLDQMQAAVVRVRGWVEERGTGPVIDLGFGGNLEILDENGPRTK